MPGKLLKKILEEHKQNEHDSLSIIDQGINNILEIPELLTLKRLTRLTLSHNRLNSIPAQIAELINLEQLNLSNNQIEELPTSISSFQNLKILKLCFNRINSLPRGFGAFPVLEILDLTTNNLSEKSLSNNFFELKSLRALYLADNFFEYLPKEINKLENLQILVLRTNELISIPDEISDLKNLKELHLQSNRLCILPPSIVQLDLFNPKSILKLDNNHWVDGIKNAYEISISHLSDFLASENYKKYFFIKKLNKKKIKNSIQIRVYDQEINGSSKTSLPPKSDRHKRLNKK